MMMQNNTYRPFSFPDIDECFPSRLGTDHRHLAHNCAYYGGLCHNVKGSFYCTCTPGYSGNGLVCDGMSNDTPRLL